MSGNKLFERAVQCPAAVDESDVGPEQGAGKRLSLNFERLRATVAVNMGKSQKAARRAAGLVDGAQIGLGFIRACESLQLWPITWSSLSCSYSQTHTLCHTVLQCYTIAYAQATASVRLKPERMLKNMELCQTTSQCRHGASWTASTSAILLCIKSCPRDCQIESYEVKVQYRQYGIIHYMDC